MSYVQWLILDKPSFGFSNANDVTRQLPLFLWLSLVRYFALNGSFCGYFSIRICSFRDRSWCGFCTTLSFVRMLTVGQFPVDLGLFRDTFLFQFRGPFWGTLHRVFFPGVVFVRLLYRWGQLPSFLNQVQVFKFVRFTSSSLLCFLFGWNWNKLNFRIYFWWTIKFFIVD